MTISGELRGMGNRPHIERRDAKAASDADKAAIDRIETMFQENRSVTVGSGRSADVTLLDIWEDSTLKPWVIKQEVRRTPEQKLLDTTLDDELRYHDAAYRAIENAIAENPGKQFARIPKPLSLLKDETRQWLLMDYLPGDNLFVHTLRAHLLNFETEETARERIASMSRDELLEELMSETFINTLPARLVQELSDGTIDELGEQHWRMIALGVNRSSKGPSVVFNALQHEALANTIDALHKAGIHHRDLHPGNVQILPDGSVGLLDFGLSTITEKDGTKDKGLYTVDVGHEFDDKKVSLLADDECLKGFWDVARKIA
ncbi:MAG: phosphotransferase [Patescibacteria group bacterium]